MTAMTEPLDRSYPVEHLRAFTAQVLAHHGVPDEDAALAAGVLAAADLRGIDSHGVVRLPAYADLLAAGRANPRPVIRVVRQTASTATVDGDGGLGLVVGPKANDLAIAKAREAGSGWVAVCNSSHFGIAGYYPLGAARHGLIGWAMTNASKLVTPAGGAERMLGTNPIAAAFPAGAEPPVVIDLATSAAAFGKVQLALLHGKGIPEGWVIDRDGAPTCDPTALAAGGAMLPLGSTPERGAHKGYCLAALVDLLCGVLSGANWGPFVPSLFWRLAVDREVGQGLGHFFGALRVDGFIDPDEFRRRMDEWVRTFRAAKPAPGVEAVLVPGDPERFAEAERRAHGVPLPPSVVAELRQLAGRTGIAFD
jgi:LDH2 family malate/lactate/ureidoglycolate dehydrogenase